MSVDANAIKRARDLLDRLDDIPTNNELARTALLMAVLASTYRVGFLEGRDEVSAIQKAYDNAEREWWSK